MRIQTYKALTKSKVTWKWSTGHKEH